MAENTFNRENYRYSEDALHLLMIGKPEVGKSSLAGVFINGGSGNVFSPDSATTGIISTPVEANGIPFVVHDTEGLDNSFDAETMRRIMDDMGRIASNQKCIVVVCIPFDGHIANHISALKTVTNLSPDHGYDVWGKTIIALTKTDNVPIAEHNQLYSRWKDRIIQELNSLHVSEFRIANLKICNTSHPSKSQLPSYPNNWFNDLFSNMNKIIPDSGVLHDFLLSRVNSSFIDYIWQLERENIISYIEDKAFIVAGCGLGFVFEQHARSRLIAFCAGNPRIVIVGAGIMFVIALSIGLYRLYRRFKEGNGQV